MRPGRLVLVSAALLASSTFTFAARGETRYEAVVQHSLEYLSSGISLASMIDGAEVTVTPVRTWKSVSGHYCREYKTTISGQAFAMPGHTGSVRCRDGDGIWKKLNTD